MTSVRLATAADHVALASLFEEMQEHYGVFCPPRATILANLANVPAGVEILVADAGSIVGFAAFSAIYPGPGLGSGLFLKELFVSKNFRGNGAGRRLIHAVAGIALQRGHQRLDWTADMNNPRALKFYESLGALAQREKVFYRLGHQALGSLASSEKSS